MDHSISNYGYIYQLKRPRLISFITLIFHQQLSYWWDIPRRYGLWSEFPAIFNRKLKQLLCLVDKCHLGYDVAVWYYRLLRRITVTELCYFASQALVGSLIFPNGLLCKVFSLPMAAVWSHKTHFSISSLHFSKTQRNVQQETFICVGGQEQPQAYDHSSFWVSYQFSAVRKEG